MTSHNVWNGLPSVGNTETNVKADAANHTDNDFLLNFQKLDMNDTSRSDVNGSVAVLDGGNTSGEAVDDIFHTSIEEGEMVDSDVSLNVGISSLNNSGPSGGTANDSKSPTANSDEPGSSFLSCSTGLSEKQQFSPKFQNSSSTANGGSPSNNEQVNANGKISPISNEDRRAASFSGTGTASGYTGNKVRIDGVTSDGEATLIGAFGGGYGSENMMRNGNGNRSFAARYSGEMSDLEVGGARKLFMGPGGVKNSVEQNLFNMRLENISPSSLSSQELKYMPKYSLKVFVGGLPPDIDEDQIAITFRHFGPVSVDWPHKSLSGSLYPPKGYAFLLFTDEISVQRLIDSCFRDEDKLYYFVSSHTIQNKLVQVRPWYLADAAYILDQSIPLDPRKTVFVGGVPRPLKAFELFMIMDRLFGGVCYVGIDTDPILEYPKGAGRVVFANHMSYIAAVSARFVQLQHGDIDKRVEVKPYVFDNQLCDICQGHRCDGKYAPYFCANVSCLQYYCENCWPVVHSRRGREYHKPLVKESGLRSSIVPFRWF